MYTIKALVLAFLVGVVLTGGVTYAVTHKSTDSSPPVTPKCANALGIAPASIKAPSKEWEYSRPAATTGGVRPTELKNHPHSLGSDD